jgi:hypothetical protein
MTRSIEKIKAKVVETKFLKKNPIPKYAKIIPRYPGCLILEYIPVVTIEVISPTPL